MEAVERLEKARELIKAFQDLKITENELEVLCLFINALFPNLTIKTI